MKRIGNSKAVGLAILLALAAPALVACGSDAGPQPVRAEPVLPASTADRLASISDRIASDLDSGDVCGAARDADQLSADIEEADLPPTLRPGVEAAATRLVDGVNCPPPPEPEPKEKKKGKEHGNDGRGHGQGGYGDAKLPWPEGHVPPGQAKKLEGGNG